MGGVLVELSVEDVEETEVRDGDLENVGGWDGPGGSRYR